MFTYISHRFCGDWMCHAGVEPPTALRVMRAHGGDAACDIRRQIWRRGSGSSACRCRSPSRVARDPGLTLCAPTQAVRHRMEAYPQAKLWLVSTSPRVPFNSNECMFLPCSGGSCTPSYQCLSGFCWIPSSARPRMRWLDARAERKFEQKRHELHGRLHDQPEVQHNSRRAACNGAHCLRHLAADR